MKQAILSRLGLLYFLIIFILNVVIYKPAFANNEKVINFYKKNVISMLRNGSLLLEDHNGREIFSYQSNSLFIPASTIKVLTSAAALHYLGENYRFKTKFYLDNNNCLVIKGSGDPNITSNSLREIAQKLKSRLLRVNCFVVDNSLFADPDLIDGRGQTLNPYDAVNTAWMVNFNTAAIKKVAGKIYSSESETPLTATAASFGASLGLRGASRVNFAGRKDLATKHGIELFSYFLNTNGVKANPKFSFGVVKPRDRLVLEYQSPNRLSETIATMLHHSNNVVANQIFLALAAAKNPLRLNIANARWVLNQFASTELGWINPRVVEGSGLSRKTAVTAKDMIKLLRWFEPYQKLLKLEDGFRSKTGTLNGVNTLIGYFNIWNKRFRFVILINSKVPFDYKFRVARELRRGLLEKKIA